MVIEFGNLKNIKLNARVLRRWNSLSELQKFYLVDLNIFLFFFFFVLLGVREKKTIVGLWKHYQGFLFFFSKRKECY